MMGVRKKLLALAIVGVTTIVYSLRCGAADIFSDKWKLYLNGEIHQGDSEQLASILSKTKRARSLTVNTLGGDVREALRIAELVRGSRIDVQVAKSGRCVSACFFIYLEGYSRNASWANADGTLPSSIRSAGPIGIHRPYLNSVTSNLESAQNQEIVMKNVRSYLATKLVPQYLVDEMMARPSNDIYWLTERDVVTLGEYDPGVEEVLIAKCGYKRTNAMFEENWSKERISRMYNCSFDYWDEHLSPLQLVYLSRLKSGWRPWFGK